MFEIESPEVFYQSLLNDRVSQPSSKVVKESIHNTEIDSDKFMERILYLEEKLEADLKRKQKFQKVKLQEEWVNEIKSLYLKLDQ